MFRPSQIGLLLIVLAVTLDYSRAQQLPGTPRNSDCRDLSGSRGGERNGCENGVEGLGFAQPSPSGSGAGSEGAMANVLVLDGTWKIRNSLNTIQLNGSVPGNVYSALQSAGLIDDPNYGTNDVEYRWVALDSWTYSRTFDASQLNLRESSRLSCYGLDTVSTVKLNGIEIGRSDNQFVQYDFNITGVIQPGTNEIEIEFTSAVTYASDRSSNHEYPVPPACPPADYSPECHANFIRKAQCSFSWDWGPAFPTQGIWKTIQIETFSMATIRSVTPLPERDDSAQWWLNVTVLFDLATPETSVDGVLTHDIPGLSTLFQYPIRLPPGVNTFNYHVPAPNALEWWPRGYGAQRLYSLSVTFKPSTPDAAESRFVRRIGFRTVEVVQDSIVDAGENSGSTFYFRINGLPIFMKGSNWIPMDSFIDRVTYERLRALMEAAVEVNMNSIRIWGGGIYETDDFYDIADELGILVWQDMMFACSMYPVDEDFLRSVRTEIRYQVRRLSSHPSLVAWTANNENEGALVDNWYGTGGAMYPRYKEDYVKLYIDTVRDEILAHDWTRAFLSSSPTNGHVTEGSGWISESPRPGQPQYGDVHYYNYESDCLDHSIYPPTRYASEYGYQSWPAYETLLRVAEPEQLYHGSDFFNHREHHHAALQGTETQIRNHFTWPSSGDQLRDFKTYIFLTQAAQAVCYQSETEFYRRSRSVADIQTMGALYWQHNDIWQAPSWSTIDYEGRWKLAHYFAARFFADPMLSVIREQSNVAIYTVSDSLSPVDDVTLVIQVWTWSGASPLLHKSSNILIAAEGAYKVFEQSLSDLLLTEAGCSSPEACFILTWVEDSTQARLTHSSVFYPVSWKNVVGLSDPQLSIDSVLAVDPMTFTVAISSRSVSVFTWLTSGDIEGRFSDNGFLLTPQTLQLKFYSRRPDVTATDLRASITITSLWNQYNG